MGQMIADIMPFPVSRRGATMPSVGLDEDEGRVAGLLDCQLADKFHAWFGGSGRRYLTSVFAVDHHAADLGLPEFDSFVLLSVGLRGRTRRALGIAAIEGGRDRRRALQEALAMGVEQWHVHLLGSDSVARSAIVADLALRHARATIALSA